MDSRDGRGNWRNRSGRGRPPFHVYNRQGGSRNYTNEGLSAGSRIDCDEGPSGGPRNYSNEGPSGCYSDGNWSSYDDGRKRTRDYRAFSPRRYDNSTRVSEDAGLAMNYRREKPPPHLRGKDIEDRSPYDEGWRRYNSNQDQYSENFGDREQSRSGSQEPWKFRNHDETVENTSSQGYPEGTACWSRRPRNSRERFRDEHAERYQDRSPSSRSRNRDFYADRDKDSDDRKICRGERLPQYSLNERPSQYQAQHANQFYPGMKRGHDEAMGVQDEEGKVSDDEMPSSDDDSDNAPPPQEIKKEPRKKKKRVKPVRVFVKNLPMDFLKEDIIEDLRCKGFKVRCANRFKPLQVYHVQLTPTDNIMDVFNVKQIKGIDVSIVEPKTLSKKQKFLNQVLPGSAVPASK